MTLICVFVRTPEDFLGDVVGELNRIGGTLEEMLNDSSPSLILVRAWLPVNELVKFEAWLLKITKGKGQISSPSTEKN